MPKPPLKSDPKLIERIQQDIASLGLVGEKDAGLLAYIVATSRLLRKPLALVTRGPSGSGKSEIPKLISEMMPPDSIIRATAMTPNVLYRMPPGSLEHKILFMGERKHRDDAEAADANAAIRQLLSEHRISKLLNVREGGKDWEPKLIEQEGPVAYFESTTSKSIFAEDLNRMLQVTTDASPEQTRRVMRAMAHQHINGSELDSAEIIAGHRQFQESLGRCEVQIPYAEVLAVKMPAGKIESRRAFPQALATIEAVALLHQHQRKRDSKERLVATVEDYVVSRRLLLAPLCASIGLSGVSLAKYKSLRKKLPQLEFDSNQAEKAGGFNNKMTCQRTLKELVEFGVLKLTAKGTSHKAARWRWVNRDEDEKILPTIESIERFVTS